MNVLNKIINNRPHYTKAKKGVELIDMIYSDLLDDGLNEMTREEMKSILGNGFDSFKDGILKDTIKTNQYFSNNRFIKLPFNSQNYPDFIVIKNDIIHIIDTRYSTKSARKPVWNSGIPRETAIYVFGSKEINKNGDITIFKGSSISSNEIRNKMINIFEKYEKMIYKDCESIYLDVKNNKGGFQPYLRKAYNQKKHKDKDRYITDFFNNNSRETMEIEAIEFYDRKKW